jgi:5'-3' exoribonuclease 1
MGIPFYFSHLIKTHRHILNIFTPSTLKIDNFFIDANPLIYNSIKEYTNNSDIINNVITQINQLIAKFSPKKNVYIAFDGVAPVSKLEQQRGRRYKKRYEVIGDDSIQSFNSAEITPGTPFMIELNNALYTYFHNLNSTLTNSEQEEDSGNKNMNNVSLPIITFNGPNETGEGEHKIFSFIRNNKNDLLTDINVIYGLDADLIMLCLNHLKFTPRIYLFRETPHFIQAIDETLIPNETYILDISRLSSTIREETQMSPEDYIFVCFLLGNDFLPHFPSINIRTGGHSKLMDAFKDMPEGFSFFDPTSKKIKWTSLKLYFQRLETKEIAFLQDEMKQRDRAQRYYYTNSDSKDKQGELQQKITALPTYERELERSINPFKPGWQNRYYTALFRIKNKPNVEFKQNVCLNYLYGLEWTYKYYTDNCPDWRWKYKYFYPPLLEDLVQYIPMDDDYEFISENINNIPITSTTQLCYVLPKEYFNLLPHWITEPLLRDHPEWYIENGEEDEVEFIWAFCKYFWEAHPILPEIPVEELENYIKRLIS